VELVRKKELKKGFKRFTAFAVDNFIIRDRGSVKGLSFHALPLNLASISCFSGIVRLKAIIRRTENKGRLKFIVDFHANSAWNFLSFLCDSWWESRPKV
jgi:hypothetical protein